MQIFLSWPEICVFALKIIIGLLVDVLTSIRKSIDGFKVNVGKHD